MCALTGKFKSPVVIHVLLSVLAIRGRGGVATATDAEPEMTRIFLNKSKCIDGSPALYYLSRNVSSSKYIIWLEGGGVCEGLADCEARAKGSLGSSKDSKPTVKDGAGKGLLRSNASTNPDFNTWNHIYVPYVSGDVWSGQKEEATNPFPGTNPHQWKGYFQGHAIVAEVVESLKQGAGLSTATEVILTGCSAGGIGTIVNCDYVADAVPHARASCRPEAGWFGLAINDYPQFAAHKDSADMRHLASSNWSMHVEPWTMGSPAAKACAADVKSGRRTIDHCTEQQLGPVECCGLPPIIYQYSETPMFVSENTCDSYQVFEQGKCPQKKKNVVAEALYAEYLRGVLAGSLNGTVAYGAKREQDGMFAPACLQHCMEWDKGPTVHHRTHNTAFGDWYFKRPPPAGQSNYMYINFDSNPVNVEACKGN